MENDTSQIEQLVKESLEILEALGIPLQGRTLRRNERTAKAFLAVAGIQPGRSWSMCKSFADGHKLTTREIIRYMNTYLGEELADSSYDDIRRKDLDLPVLGCVVSKSADNPNASTNDGTRAYAIPVHTSCVLKAYGTTEWLAAVQRFQSENELLRDRLNTNRELQAVPVVMPDGTELTFSAGIHNEIQRDIINEFLPRYGHGAEILYVGDTTDKLLYVASDRLKQLNIPEPSHDELPDVIAYSPSKNWVFLIEAVHSANPITEVRKLRLDSMMNNCPASIIYVTAFHDKLVFRKFMKDIAWETEVWISEDPDHMIHFNGDKFMGPYQL